MNFNEAVKRLRFTISKQNKPNKTDAEALTSVLQWIGREKEKKINKNRLFAKLYLECLTREIVFCNSEYLLAQKRLERILKMPLELYYKRFSEEIRLNQISVFSEMLGIEEKPISWMNEENAKKARQLLKENQQEFISVLESDFWSLENTIPRLNDLITDVINNNENLP